jgi:regulator of cell morphogenesis and NO signaling
MTLQAVTPSATHSPAAIAGAVRAPIALLPPREDPERLSDDALVARIVGEHHANLRRSLPFIVSLLAKVAGFYRRRNAKLSALCDAGEELAERLDEWIEDEEQNLFPALLAQEPVGEPVRRQLERMGKRHRAMELLLERIRWLADDYAVPSWADRGYQALMEELDALERDQREHARLEGAILLPRLAARLTVAA